MKKITIILSLLFFIKGFGHEQNVHRYIVSEAWQLLTYQVPELSNSIMAPWIGNLGNTTYLTSIISGTHNEDKQDIIYMNCGFNLNMFGINIVPCTRTTINHFWNADYGDNDPVTILGTDDNALKKAEHLWYGTHNFFVGVSFANYGVVDKVDHYGLSTLYHTGNVKWIGYWNSIGQYFSKNLDKTYSTEYRRRISYDILGRICHLLADMSVPAHAHNDAHSPVSEEGTDDYEQWVKNNHSSYTWVDALAQGGTLFDVTEKNFPIRYLMYVANQYADFFPSDGDWSGIYLGDRVYSSAYNKDGKIDYYPILDNIFSQLGSPPSSVNNSLQASHLIPFAIRATASLLYYFANAQLDSIDVYKKLVGLDSIKAEVSRDDTLKLSFEDVSVGTEKWLLLIGQQQPIYKDKVAGSILGGGKENTAEFSSFRLRKNPTYQWVLVPDGNSSSLQVDIVFQSEAEIDYTELSHKLELPFTVYTPQLLYAEHSVFGDVTSLLNQIDEQYSVLNIDEMITLEYSAAPINEGMERTFVFVSRGRYERLENNMLAKGKSQTENKNQNLSSTENPSIVYEYGLSQNFPNPFNPVTTISYQIKELGLVQLKVYNLLGQEIVTLVNEVQSPGIYESLFDARNLPSGVYIYSLRVNDFVQNNKMTLLK